MGYIEDLNEIADGIVIKNSTILITGASGLIGSTLVDTFILANDTKCSNNKIYVLGRNREKLSKRYKQNVSYIIQDINEQLSDDIEFDYIFNLASNADPVKYAVEPVETILTNVVGNNNMLKYCAVHNNCKIVIGSSFEVYGQIDDTTLYDEGCSGAIDIQNIRNGYPESKRVSELLLKSYCQEYKVYGIIARLSSVYGPNMALDDSKAHAQFIRNGVRKENIVLKSEGKQKRSYTYVLDAVSALLFLAVSGEKGEAYNVANKNSISSIAELATLIAHMAGTHVVYQLPNSIEKRGFSKPQDCVLCTNKIEGLGWSAKYDLYHGLRDTIVYMENKI